jgi:hypothetical protein
MSPTQRSLAHLRSLGYVCQVVETWNSFARVRRDLFGCIDIVALKDGAPLLGIQCTSTPNLSARRTKCEAMGRRWITTGNQFELWGWAKQGPRGQRKIWTLKREAL